MFTSASHRPSPPSSAGPASPVVPPSFLAGSSSPTASRFRSAFRNYAQRVSTNSSLTEVGSNGGGGGLFSPTTTVGPNSPRFVWPNSPLTQSASYSNANAAPGSSSPGATHSVSADNVSRAAAAHSHPYSGAPFAGQYHQPAPASSPVHPTHPNNGHGINGHPHLSPHSAHHHHHHHHHHPHPLQHHVTHSLESQPAMVGAQNNNTEAARTAGAQSSTEAELAVDGPAAAEASSASAAVSPRPLPSIRITSYVDPRPGQRPSLSFSPVTRILPTGNEIIRVGRYSEREGHASSSAANERVPSSAPVGFKSKVVSRRHCEFWFAGGRWFIKDVKSSSGTFLNHIRLSPPGTESKPFPVHDGDVIQLGIDFKGGEEIIFRCVKMRLELNKGWNSKPTAFNLSSHKRLRSLVGQNAGGGSQDCSICLNSIAPCQSLFVAPCSHTWHYKCIRALLNTPAYPYFTCPNCRTNADLEAEVDDPEEAEVESDAESDAEDNVEDDAGPEGPEVDVDGETNQMKGKARARINAQGPAAGASSSMAETPAGGGAVDAEFPSVASSRVSEEELLSLNGPVPGSPTSDGTPRSKSPTLPQAAVTWPRSSLPIRGLPGSGSGSGAFPVPMPRNGKRTPSPSNNAPVGAEGPITPRNDAGPWVFDGSGGRRPMAVEDAMESLARAGNA